jgi:histone demethylase JARID1
VDFASKKKFQTKQQLLHRLQEGISFGDGEEYTASEYTRMASDWAKEWKAQNYPDHDLLRRTQKPASGDNDSREEKCYTPKNLERDYWHLVETHSKQVAVEYGNDVGTDVYGSGFPLSERGRSICGKKNPEKTKQPEPKFGTKDFYKETWWNLNNIPSAPNSVLGHVKVGINGINGKKLIVD